MSLLDGHAISLVVCVESVSEGQEPRIKGFYVSCEHPLLRHSRHRRAAWERQVPAGFRTFPDKYLSNLVG